MSTFGAIFLIIIFLLLCYFIIQIQLFEFKHKTGIVVTSLFTIILFVIVAGVAHNMGIKRGHIMMYEDEPIYKQIIYYDEEGEPAKKEYKLIIREK